MRLSLSIFLCLLCLVLSHTVVGQGNPIYADYDLSNMDRMLEGIYNSVISRASSFVSIASVIGVVGAVIMISSHIYTKLLNQEPINFASLTRPFVILMGLVFYLPLLSFINTTLNPTVYVTKGMVQNENEVVEKVLARLADARRQTKAYAVYVGEDGSGDFDEYLEIKDIEVGSWGLDRVSANISFRMEATMYQAQAEMRMAVFMLLSWVYTASVFIINTIRSFTLAVLGLVGPLALAFSLWPGFQSSFLGWAGRYVTVYLWLPVANIFGFIISLIQVEFAEMAIKAAEEGGGAGMGYTEADGLYFILLLTGAVGYFTVPLVTTYMISASGASALAGGMSGVGRIGLGLSLLAARSASGGGSNWDSKVKGTMGNVVTRTRNRFRGGGGGGGGGGNGGTDTRSTSAPDVPGSRPPRLR